MTYRVDPVTQRDGSELQNSNCLMAVAAVGLAYETATAGKPKGAKTSTGAKMRDFSGDTSGGTNSDEVVRAWDRGYDETALMRDGQSWDQVVEDHADGRLVMLQVWHATMGGPCLSGSGQYGHGIAVAPETDGDRWLVADPWCKPPKWAWWPVSKLKAGAIEWADRCAREAGGPLPGLDPMVRAAVIRGLFHRYRPDRPAVDDPPPSAGGGGGVLFTSTHPNPEGGDMSIDVSANEPLSTGRVVDLAEGTPYWADGGLTDSLGELSEDRTAALVGNPAASGEGRAVAIKTSRPYDDGVGRMTIVYFRQSDLDGHIRPAPPPEPPDPDDAIAEAVAERDGEWRAWLDAAPGEVLTTAQSILAWADLAPDVDDGSR